VLKKYPDSFFEMSVVMPQREPYSRLRSLLAANVAEELLRKIEVIAVYEGKPLAADEKSISVKLFLGAEDRTLSGEELAAVQDRLVAAIDESTYALRS